MSHGARAIVGWRERAAHISDHRIDVLPKRLAISLSPVCKLPLGVGSIKATSRTWQKPLSGWIEAKRRNSTPATFLGVDESMKNPFADLRPFNLKAVLRDVFAGLTLASVNVPQVLGYARIA